MADDLRAADVFKVFVETNSSIRQALESNVKALTEIVGTVRAVEQSMRDQSEIVGSIKTFITDFKRMQQKREELFVGELKKAHFEAQENLAKMYKDMEEKSNKNDKKVIYWLLGTIGLLVAALIGLVGAKIMLPEKHEVPTISVPAQGK